MKSFVVWMVSRRFELKISFALSIDLLKSSIFVSDDWVEVASDPDVVNFILRLHTEIGKNQRAMGELKTAVATFEDAYKVSSTFSNPCSHYKRLKRLCSDSPSRF